jgi:hypothetical protein
MHSTAAVIATLRAINPREALRVALPVEVIEIIAPWHDAIMRAKTRPARRAAWREWNKAIAGLIRKIEALN